MTGQHEQDERRDRYRDALIRAGREEATADRLVARVFPDEVVDDQALDDLRALNRGLAQLKTAVVLGGVALSAAMLVGISAWFRPIAVAALVAALAFACTAPRPRERP